MFFYSDGWCLQLTQKLIKNADYVKHTGTVSIGTSSSGLDQNWGDDAHKIGHLKNIDMLLKLRELSLCSKGKHFASNPSPCGPRKRTFLQPACITFTEQDMKPTMHTFDILRQWGSKVSIYWGIFWYLYFRVPPVWLASVLPFFRM